MKSIALLGVTVLYVANARSIPSNEQNLGRFSAPRKSLPAKKHRVLEISGPDDDDPWEIGTKIYDEFDDGWYVGEITDYDENTYVYTVTWSSKDTGKYRDGDIDEAVAAAADDDGNWEIGTVVYKKSYDGWSVGDITRYHEGSDTYTVAWPDNSVETYVDDDVDRMVYDPAYISNSRSDDNTSIDDDPWDIGTKVYDEFDDGWYMGEITDYDENTYVYTVTWSSKDTGKYRDNDIDEAVNSAADDDGHWEIGTVVYKQFPDGWSVGKITRYHEGSDTYTVTWSDNSIETYVDDDVDRMVYDRAYIPNSRSEGNISGDDDPWEIGTKVYDEFNDGWYAGEITDYNKNTYVYTVTWSSKDTDTYRYDDIDRIVYSAADNDDDWDIGTVVYKQSYDGWSVGKITRYQEGSDTYTVTWQDNNVETYTADDIDVMVLGSASRIPDSNIPQLMVSGEEEDDMSIGGVSLLVVSCVFFVTLLGVAARAIYTREGRKGESDTLELSSKYSDNPQPEMI